MNEEDLKRQLFELSFTLDCESAGKNYIALRNAHYNNVRWLHDNGLSEEYYHFFVNKMKEAGK